MSAGGRANGVAAAAGVRRDAGAPPARCHVVLLTYGEPPRPKFLAQLRYSWRILRGLTRTVADIPFALLPVIALARARARVAMWTAERFDSPLEPLTLAQRSGLERALRRAAPRVDWRVHVAYEFRDPLLADAIGALPPDEPALVIPMYVADSAFTHQLSRDVLGGRPEVARRPAPVTVLPPLDVEDLAALSAAHLERELDRRGVRTDWNWALVLAAHGTLLDPPRPYETGRAATEALASAIARRVAHRFGRTGIGWLNHVYGGRWTEPAADQALAQAAEAGFERVVYFPFGFLADNAESLLEGRQALRTRPGLEAVHVACLNDDPALMDALAGQVIDHLHGTDAHARGRAGTNGDGAPAAQEGLAHVRS